MYGEITYKIHPGKKTQPREKFAPSAPHYCPGALHELFIGVAFFGPRGCVLLPWVWVTCATGLAMGNQICSQFHSDPSLRAAIHTQISVSLYDRRYLTICWAGFAQIHRGGPVKKFGKVSCRSQIERSTSHSSGTKEDPDFQRSHKLNWTPNHNRGWVEACAHAR